MTAVVPVWSNVPNGMCKHSSPEFLREPSFNDLKLIASTGDLFSLGKDYEVPSALTMASYESYESEGSEASERMTLAELGVVTNSYSDNTTAPILSPMGSITSLELPSSPPPTSTLGLSLDATDLAHCWQSLAGSRHPMKKDTDEILSIIPTIPSAAHVAASLDANVNMPCDDDVTVDEDDFLGLAAYQHKPQAILSRLPSSSFISEGAGSQIHNAGVHHFEDVTSGAGIVPVVSSSFNKMIHSSDMQSKPVNRPPPPRPVSKKSKAKRQRTTSSRSFVDKRPRYKGRFVRPEELELLIALEKQQLSGSASEELAVVPTSCEVEAMHHGYQNQKPEYAVGMF